MIYTLRIFKQQLTVLIFTLKRSHWVSPYRFLPLIGWLIFGNHKRTQIHFSAEIPQSCHAHKQVVSQPCSYILRHSRSMVWKWKDSEFFFFLKIAHSLNFLYFHCIYLCWKIERHTTRWFTTVQFLDDYILRCHKTFYQIQIFLFKASWVARGSFGLSTIFW